MRVLPYIGYVGICGPKAKGCGCLAVLVINRVSILAISFSERIWFLQFSLEFSMFFRRRFFFIIIDKPEVTNYMTDLKLGIDLRQTIDCKADTTWKTFRDTFLGLVMLVSRNVFHVVSALQSIFCLHTFFWLIRSLVDPTLAAFIVCGPLQFLVSH